MAFYYGLNVLVTGGYGLIGKPLVTMLEEQGTNVTIYDKTDGKDVNSVSHLETAVRGKDIVFHLAAISGVEHSRELGYHAWYVNTFGTLNVLEAIKRNGNIATGVFATSNHVYGRQESFPVRENAPLNQLDTYSASKIAADYMARSYYHNYKTSTVIIRNTNCFGPDDPHLDHLIPGTIMSVLDGERPIIKSRGTTRKTYLHVDDVARAYLQIAQYCIEREVYGDAFNVAGEPISVLELVRLILNVMGSDLNPIIQGTADDQQDEGMDDRKARVLAGWDQQSPLEEAISLTVAGFKERYEHTGISTG